MISKVLDFVLEKRVIVNCARDPYLHRWYLLRSERLGVFIHKFVRSDEDRALHDHPWSFLVIPLWGGYIEHSDRPLTLDEWWAGLSDWCESPHELDLPAAAQQRRIAVRRRVWPLISARYRGTDYRHRVELIHERPSWSLFIRFTKTREWGFWLPEGFQLWNKWWQDKCE